MSLTDLIKRRKNIVNQESQGINLALSLINEFKGRTFTFKGLKRKYFGIKREELIKLIQEEIESMIVLYNYKTNSKTYIDKKGIPQLELKLIGKVSIMHRYNPLDIQLDIATETIQN